MAVTVEAIKELRELTGVGMLDCKNALEEAQRRPGEGQADPAPPRHRCRREAGRPRDRPGPRRSLHPPRRSPRRPGGAELRDGLRGPHGRLQKPWPTTSPCRWPPPNPAYVSPEELPSDSDGDPRDVCLLAQPFIKDPVALRPGPDQRRHRQDGREHPRAPLSALRAGALGIGGPWPRGRYSRVLLKLSGEALMGEQPFGIDAETVLALIAGQIRNVAGHGHRGGRRRGRRQHLPRRRRQRRRHGPRHRRLRRHAGHRHQRPGPPGRPGEGRRRRCAPSPPSPSRPWPSPTSGGAPSATWRRGESSSSPPAPATPT